MDAGPVHEVVDKGPVHLLKNKNAACSLRREGRAGKGYLPHAPSSLAEHDLRREHTSARHPSQRDIESNQERRNREETLGSHGQNILKASGVIPPTGRLGYPPLAGAQEGKPNPITHWSCDCMEWTSALPGYEDEVKVLYHVCQTTGMAHENEMR